MKTTITKIKKDDILIFEKGEQEEQELTDDEINKASMVIRMFGKNNYDALFSENIKLTIIRKE